MAYKVKYRLDYCNKEKLNARLDFEIKDYTSTIIHDIVGTQDAFSYKVRNEKPDRSGYFRTLEADINIFEDENFKIDSLLTSDETAIRVKFYIEGQLEFVGFIIPDFFEVSIDKPRVISMVASDRIGTLKNQTLPRETGIQSFRYMLEQSLLKTGLDLPLNSTINFNPVGETGDFLTNTGGLMERLSSDKGASISCYDIIKSILIVSNSVLFQEGGEWHILNKYEFESRPTTKDIEQINVGGRRLINPPSSKVGVMAEFGGGLKYPTNYNFQSLNGWTAKNGFIAQLNTKQIDGFSNGNPIYGSNVGTSNLLNKNNTEPLTKPDEKPYLESQGIKVVSVNPLKARIKTEINVTTDGSIVFYMIYAKKGNQTKILGPDGFYDGNTGDRGSNLALAFRVGDRDDQSQAYTGSNIIEGVLEDEINVTNWNIYIRIYGTASTIITFVNFAYVEFPSENENKGNLFKIEQGVNFTKENEIDTTIFGDYINKGINGYFYDYQRDEKSSIFYKIGESWESLGLKWQTASNNNADYLLLHSVRQRAIMFSSPHNIITAVVSGRFSALDIYNICGKKYVLVEAEYDFYRNETELRIEEIKYDNSVLKTDYIYSYFGGEDTTSISGVSGVSSGGSGGGMTSEQLSILTNLSNWWKLDEEGNLYTEKNMYSQQGVSALGLGEGGSGGGGGGGDFSRLDRWTDYTAPKAGWVLSAFLGKDLDTRVNALQSGSATNIEISGVGNAVTGVSKSGNTLTFDKGINFALSTHNHDTLYKPIGYVPSWSEITNKPSTFAPSTHTHTIAQVTGLQTALDSKEPSFTKNTAFNKNFGTTAGTVAQGNDSRINNGQTAFGWGNHSSAGYALNSALTAHTGNTTVHITATERTNWNDANSKKHTHSNKALLDLITQSNIDVLNLLSVVDGNIKVDTNLWATGGISALGLGEGGGGGGGGVDMLDSWANYTTAKANFYAPASLLVPFRNDTLSRLASLESGSATSIVTTGSGNAITSLTKSGSVITANKGLTFALSTHSHTIAQITGLQGALDLKATQSDITTAIDGIEIGGRNYFSIEHAKLAPNVGGYKTVTIQLLPNTQYIASTSIPEIAAGAYWIFADKYPISRSSGVNGLAINKPKLITTDSTGKIDVSAPTIHINQIINGTEYFQIEKGTVATDWTPAPEDQVSDWSVTNVNSFAFLKNKPTQLSQFNDNMGVASHIANKSNPHEVSTAQIGAVNLTTNQTIGGVKTFTNNVTAPTFIGALSGNASSATKLQTARTIAGVSFDGSANIAIPFANLANKPTTLSGYGITDAVTTNTTQTITGAKTFSSLLTASAGINTPKVIFAAAGWSLEQVGTELQMKHNGVIKQRMLSNGTILAVGGITALGT